MMCAYVAPEMLIDGEKGEDAQEAYRRMESAVLSDPSFYHWFTEINLYEETVGFYNILTNSDVEFHTKAK